MKLAVGVIIMRGWRVCLNRRRGATDGRHEGHYCGAGGMVEPGEDFITAGLRELAEEAGVQMAPWNLFLLHENLGRTSRFLYRVQHLLLELKPGVEPIHTEPHKSTGWEWVPIPVAVFRPLVPGMRMAILKAVVYRTSWAVSRWLGLAG